MTTANGHSDAWGRAPLGEVLEINPRRPDLNELHDDDQVTFVPMAALDDQSGQITAAEKVPLSKVRNKSYRTFASGDVLFAKITPSMENGKSAVVPTLAPDVGFGSTEFHVLRPSGKVLSAYVWRYVRQPRFRRDARTHMTGSVGQERVPVSFLAEAQLPLPPLDEQEKIIGWITDYETHFNRSRAGIAAARRAVRRLGRAVIGAATSGRLTADWRAEHGRDDVWPTHRLGDLIIELTQGWSPKCRVNPSPSLDVWGVIKTTAIQPMKFDPEENKELPDGLAPRPQLEIAEGDLLITRAGPRWRAAIACLVRDTRPRLMVCDKAYRFRVDESRVLPEFVEIVLNAPAMAATLDDLKTGSSDSGMNLTQEKFNNLQIPLPELDEQQEIMVRVAGLAERERHVLTAIADAEGKLGRSLDACLERAFGGGFVLDQGPKAG